MLLPAVGGFQFGRSPKVLLAIGEVFVLVRREVPVLLPATGGFQFGDILNKIQKNGEQNQLEKLNHMSNMAQGYHI